MVDEWERLWSKAIEGGRRAAMEVDEGFGPQDYYNHESHWDTINASTRNRQRASTSLEEVGKFVKWGENDALNMQFRLHGREEYDTLANEHDMITMFNMHRRSPNIEIFLTIEHDVHPTPEYKGFQSDEIFGVESHNEGFVDPMEALSCFLDREGNESSYHEICSSDNHVSDYEDTFDQSDKEDFDINVRGYDEYMRQIEQVSKEAHNHLMTEKDHCWSKSIGQGRGGWSRRYKRAYGMAITPFPDKTMWEIEDLNYVVKPPMQTRPPPGRPRKKRIKLADKGSSQSKVGRVHVINQVAPKGGLSWVKEGGVMHQHVVGRSEDIEREVIRENIDEGKSASVLCRAEWTSGLRSRETTQPGEKAA
ncbi:hypothetical protein QJS10_CPB18g00537 [Acorus calamus]|uniref:Uncharacterized protein n=1 Tax=Acorus calamus TaxID=4465 RepID=A0AAV9CJW6_ACOCL|nr:hypothetical protein QJS10_CPB18g00537 [Acorus calamus]